MLTGDKNLKDTQKDFVKDTLSIPALYEAEGVRLEYYSRTQKLITALYIVTDIIDREEPIRNKLRTLGVEILSDISLISKTAFDILKIDQVLSFLSIASTMNFISEMNYAILKKEFLELKTSIQEQKDIKPRWLEEFFLTPSSEDVKPKMPNSIQYANPKGHIRIGVQNGSTLLKALNKVKDMDTLSDTKIDSRKAEPFSLLKKERRFNIVNIIKNNGGNATIKDIKDKINVDTKGAIISSEKTSQRELMSMIKDDVLYKTGKKRWSRYFIKN